MPEEKKKEDAIEETAKEDSLFLDKDKLAEEVLGEDIEEAETEEEKETEKEAREEREEVETTEEKKEEEEEKEKEEKETTEETTEEEKDEEEKLLAGKFKTADDLKKAFRELGGNPDEYEDIKMLEEAYRVREREFSRARQQLKPKTPPPEVSAVSEERDLDLGKVASQHLLVEVPHFPAENYMEGDTIDLDRWWKDNATALVKNIQKAVLTGTLGTLQAQNVIRTYQSAVEEEERQRKLEEEFLNEYPILKEDPDLYDVFTTKLAYEVEQWAKAGSPEDKKPDPHKILSAILKKWNVGEKKTDKKEETEEKPPQPAGQPPVKSESSKEEVDPIEEMVEYAKKRKQLLGDLL